MANWITSWLPNEHSNVEETLDNYKFETWDFKGVQTKNIQENDIVYILACQPINAILYKLEVTKVTESQSKSDSRTLDLKLIHKFETEVPIYDKLYLNSKEGSRKIFDKLEKGIDDKRLTKDIELQTYLNDCEEKDLKASKLARADLEENIVIIKVNKYTNGMSEKELYEATRGAWENKEKISKAEYCLSVFKSTVVEVYKIDKWQKPTTTSKDTSRLDANNLDNTIEFIGETAEEEIRDKYLGKSVANIFKYSEYEFNKFNNSGKTFLKPVKVFLNEYSHNTILYGPPGTGKTYNTVNYAVAIIERKIIEKVQTEAKKDYKTVKDRYNEYHDKGRIEFTTFHQSYGYEEFIEGIRPIINTDNQSQQTNGDISYKIESGIFKRFCERAKANPDENYVFIIDEINRGNISKIFGELITLLEPTKRLGQDEELTVRLPYSGVYDEKDSNNNSNNEFGVPSNVYIIGTMNTADRSITQIDTALRRRFSFVEMMPDLEVLKDMGLSNITIDNKELDVVKMLETMNKRIEYLFDREHTIGHAFFTGLKGLKDKDALNKLETIFSENVIPLLQEYFYDDYEKIRLVLADNFKSEDYQFITKKGLNPSGNNGIFKGSTTELEGKYSYEINKEAYKHIESYTEIY